MFDTAWHWTWHTDALCTCPGAGQGSPRCSQTVEQPGPAMPESEQVWGGKSNAYL